MDNEQHDWETQQQAQALKSLLACLGMETQAQLIEATGISKSVISRSINGKNLMTPQNRVKMARCLGKRCKTEQELEGILRETGWYLTSAEWREARQYMMKDDTPTYGVPWLKEDVLIWRAREMERLQKRLLASRGRAPRVVIMQGIAGVGKSTVVNQLVRSPEIDKCYRDGIYWLRMENQSSEQEAIWKFVEMVAEITEPKSQDPWGIIQEALTRKEVLVVLDGVSVPIDLPRWQGIMPRFGSIVVTTRRMDLAPPDQQIQLSPMTPEEARRLLTRHVEPADAADADIEWLLETLDGLPLALAIVNTIAQWEQGFDQLIAEMRQEIIPTLTIGQAKDKSARSAFTLSYRRLDGQSAQLFRSLGRSPQPFDVEAMAHMLDWSPTDTGKAFRFLVQMGLVDVEATGCYRTHRLLHEYADVLSREEDDEQHTVWNRRFAAYYLEVTHRASKMWNQGAEQAALESWQRALGHIERGCRYAACLKRSDWVLEYLESTTYYLGSKGLSKLVDRWQRRFEEVIDEQETEKWLRGNLFLGDAHLLLEKHERAMEVLQRARQTAAESGDAHNWFVATLNLARALLAGGRIENAMAITADEAFVTYADNLPSEDPWCIEAWSIIGLVHKTRGDYQAAYHYLLKAWKFATHNKDRTSPWNQQAWTQARILLALGEIMMGWENYEDALRFADNGRKIAEERSYDILWRYHTLRSIRAMVYLGQIEEAEQRLTELRSATRDQKAGEPLLLLAEADVTWAAGRHQAAEQAYRKAAEQLAGQVEATGIWHLLGTRLDEIGQTDRAMAVWQRARESGRRTGNQYKYLQATLSYAERLLDEGQESQARRLLAEVVEQGSKVAPHLAAAATELLG